MIAWFRRWMGWEEVDALAMALTEIFSRHIAVGQVKKIAVVEKAFLLVLAQAKGEKRSAAGEVIKPLALPILLAGN